MRKHLSRRGFVAASAAGMTLSGSTPSRLAILGGEPVRREPFPTWPKYGKPEEDGLRAVLNSGTWNRISEGTVEKFERLYAKMTGARHCLATANGTGALFTSLNALEVGPGDEVIVPPYTFVATVNVVLLQHALPIFVDTDIETFQIDASKVEAAITDRTAAIIPVHLGGSTADLDRILKTAAKRQLPVIEDACQAHLAEWRGRKAGTLGSTGCFSFQASKNLNSGEGGAILTSDDELAERCYAFHTNGRGRKTGNYNFTYAAQGTNLRLTAFQAAILMAQMRKLDEESRRRETNAAYLTKMLEEIPGIKVARTYDGCNRNAWHLFMFRYEQEAFAGVPRARFLDALRAEGIPSSGGYRPLNRASFIQNVLSSKAYRRIYPENTLKEWEERNQCPANDRLCEQAVWFTQTMLLGEKHDMEQIAGAVAKIQKQAAQLGAS